METIINLEPESRPSLIFNGVCWFRAGGGGKRLNCYFQAVQSSLAQRDTGKNLRAPERLRKQTSKEKDVFQLLRSE